MSCQRKLIRWCDYLDLLKPAEALILETEPPERQMYWNVQLNDELWSTVEFLHRQSSLNGHQARRDTDGRFRAVICLGNPGVHNCVDPGSTLQGMLIGRWYGANVLPVPTLKKVPLPEVQRHLSDDTVLLTAAERAAQLRASVSVVSCAGAGRRSS